MKKFLAFYPAFFKWLLIAALSLGSGALVAAIIVYPLWFTATRSTVLYNWLVLTAVIVIAASVISVKFIKTRHEGATTGEILTWKFFPFMLKLFIWALIFMAAVLGTVLFMNRSVTGGIIAGAVLLGLAGLLYMLKNLKESDKNC
ncbi:MAG: hypothetical protein MJ215_02210 [Spirochaetia bacterium]|nr:hypothetical protein [Spirochaetia bacterium]